MPVESLAPSSPLPDSAPAEPGFDAAPDTGDKEQITTWVKKARHSNLANVSALSAFQRQMDRFPQLDTDQLNALFVVIRSGEEAHERLASGRRITDRKRLECERLIKQGDRAAEAVAGSTFRLVLIICRELAERRFGRERALDAVADLVGEANVSLMESIRRFDPNCGPSFPTYAARVVRNQVRYTLQRDGMVKSTASWGRMRRIAAVRVPVLAAELGRQPTEEEIRANLREYCMEWARDHLTERELQLPEAEQERLMEAKLKKQGMIGALNNLADVIQSSQPIASLDAPIAGTDGAMLGDVVPTQEEDGFDQVELTELRETLADALSDLTDRERRIIELRYGMVDGESRTYQEIGKEFSVTPERIRQIERYVLDKLRGPSGLGESLAGYLPGI